MNRRGHGRQRAQRDRIVSGYASRFRVSGGRREGRCFLDTLCAGGVAVKGRGIGNGEWGMRIEGSAGVSAANRVHEER